MALEQFAKPERLYKYMSLETGCLVLNDGTLKFSYPRNFEDTSDCSLDRVYFDVTCKNLDPLVKEDLQLLIPEFLHLNLTPELLNKAYRKRREALAEECGVTCFTLNPKHDLMWRKYGDDHNGVCLEFDNSIKENEKFPNLSVGISNHVRYGLDQSVNYCENKRLGTAMQFLSKRIEYKYEMEYRLVTKSGEGVYSFSPQFLSGVIFGAKVSKTDRENIITICRKKYSDLKFQIAVFQGEEVEYFHL